MDLNAKTAAIVIGILLLAIGILGFFANPLISPTGIFAVNITHNFIHLLTGVALLASAYGNVGSSPALKALGILYAAMAIIGFVIGGDTLMGMVAVNHADHWLHVALAIAILAAGFFLAEEPAMV
jgi:hypothetical protein